VDVSPAGAGSSYPDPGAVGALATALSNSGLPSILRSSHSGTAADIASVSLEQLKAAPMQHLLQAVEAGLFRPGVQHGETIHAVSQSMLDGFYAHPAQMTPQSSGLGMREARDSAEKSVASATRAVDAGMGHSHRIPDNLDPRNVLALADQFIQTGQFLNYLRAGILGRVVVSWYDGPIAVPAGSTARGITGDRTKGSHLRFQEILKSLWRRAPLFCLLAGWLVSGLLAGLFTKMLNVPAYKTALAFDIWGLGFLALVVLQFVVTVRTAMRPKSNR